MVEPGINASVTTHSNVAGCFIQRGERTKFSKVLVTGLGRSGTSAVASLLLQCGFFLGADTSPITHESKSLLGLLRNSETGKLLAELEGRSVHHRCIGWKDPKLFGPRAADVIRQLPKDWLLIAVFRDPLAIASRRAFSDSVDFLEALRLSVRYQERLVRFVADADKSVLLVSYERLAASNSQALQDIVAHLDVDTTMLPAISEMQNVMASQQAAYRRAAVPGKRPRPAHGSEGSEQ